MKQLLTLCTVLFLAGCGGNPGVTTPPGPVNGFCGVVQDTCRTGNPTAKGDTSSPYEWTCSGQFGGADAPCSVPTAFVESGEVFAGENELKEKVKAAGPLEGLFTIVDWTARGFDCEPDCGHAAQMKGAVLDMGMPEGSLYVAPFENFSDLFDHSGQEVRENTRVFSIPLGWAPIVSESDIRILERHGFLVVAPVVNADSFAPFGRDLWYPEHPHWSGRGDWDRSMRVFATGRVILAKYADRKPDGTIIPHEGNVKCGLAKEYCYSLFGRTGSSTASVQLGALSFYLSQLWDTPWEVIGVLNTCAEDVGEPGIDEEFGRGIVSVVCDTVQNRERTVVASSMQSMNAMAASPVLNQMVGDYSSVLSSPQSLSPRSLPAAKWFKPFYAVRGYNLETTTGYLGGQFSLKEVDLFVSGGADYAPLGVRSSLLHTARTPFTEVGVRRNLFSRDGHRVFLLGSYGYSERNSMSAHVRYAGAQYEHRFGSSSVLSLYTGHRLVRGSLGIPGYRRAGAAPVPFTDRTPEVRVSFTMSR